MRRATLLLAALGAAGVTVPEVAAAQVPGDTVRRAPRDTTNSVPVPPRPDSIRVDSGGSVVPLPASPGRDSAVRRDTLKAPTARAEAPVLLDIGPRHRWDREALFASGALTLTDLLERIPGLTSLRSGWINGPEAGAYLGSVGAVRVFYDGLALPAFDPRGGVALDLSTIELWTLEEVAIERGVQELRVYLRSLRTDRTTPQTRVDVSTGDEDTNLYRGFYGKRFRGGEVLQLAFQQYSTRSPRLGGGGDELSILGRTGAARGRWSVDLFALRANRARGDRLDPARTLRLPGLDSRRTTAYARAAYGEAEGRGLWAQIMAGALELRETSADRAASGSFAADTADTTRYQGQYVAAAGVARGVFRLSATGRLRSFQGSLYDAQSVRASIDQRFVGLSLFGEREGLDSTLRADAILRIQPLGFLAFSGAASVIKPDAATGRPQSTALRGEGAIRLGGVWVGGGAIVRDSAVLPAPLALDPGFVPVVTGRTTGTFVTVRGQVFRAIYAEMYGVRWERPGFYRPQEEARAELFVSTRWLRRFPSGNFGFRLSGVFDYRSAGFFPRLAGDDESLLAAGVDGSKVLSALLEIRIVNATLTYQLRNALGYQYQLVPDYEMPRTVNFYGVRWEFAN